MGELDGTPALVTGAAGRIGRATAMALAEAGARVVASDYDRAGLEETGRRLGGDHILLDADLSVVSEVERLVGEAAAALGGLGVLVNCAAILDPGGTVTECDPELFDRMIAVNTRAPFFAVRSALPYMLAAGKGSIVNVSSVLGLVGLAGFSPYAVSKVGLLQLTRQVAVEYGTRGIRCNAVCPGTTAHPGEFDDTEEQRELRRQLEVQHLGRLASPGEIAQVVRFLASDAASVMNGAIMAADRGYTAH